MRAKGLQADDINKLGEALIALTMELSVLRDRQKVLEALLAEAGVVMPEQIQAYQPDEALSAELADEREALIGNVLRALTDAKQQ